MKNIFNNRRGFAVVECIVAIVIIMIVVFFVFIYFSNKQRDERDEQRLRELDIVRNALYSYYDINGYYPASLSEWNPGAKNFGADAKTGTMDYDNLSSLLSAFIEDLPTDPLNPDNSSVVDNFYIYRYVAEPGGQAFAILFETERKGDETPRILR